MHDAPVMKETRSLSLFLFAVIAALAGCDTLTKPISGGDFDPLVPPGKKSALNVVEVTGFRPGQFVVATLDNASFFRKKPKDEANADKLLKAGTQMKVVAVEGSYLKVELDNGEVGYVPSILVSDPKSMPSPREVQVYPPLPGQAGDFGRLPVIPPDRANPQAPASDTLPAVIEPGAGAAPEKPAEETSKPPAGEEPKKTGGNE